MTSEDLYTFFAKKLVKHLPSKYALLAVVIHPAAGWLALVQILKTWRQTVESVHGNTR